MESINSKRVIKCSECGKVISLSEGCLRDYVYKFNTGRITCYQCSYTCFHHVDLRIGRPPVLQTKEQRKSEVLNCERAMKGQGKEVLHPIVIK